MRRLSKLRSGNSHFVKRTEHFFALKYSGRKPMSHTTAWIIPRPHTANIRTEAKPPQLTE